MKGIKFKNCYEVVITGFSKPILVCGYDFAHAEDQLINYISKLETKDAHSIVSITFHSLILD